MYKRGIVTAENRVAQQENLALWLVQNGTSPWLWVIPEDVQVSEKRGVTFLKGDRTWVAVRPLGATALKRDGSLTRQLVEAKKTNFPGHQVLRAKGNSRTFCGLAIEVGEQESHGSWGQFVDSVLRAEVDVSELEQGVARYKSADGKWLGIHWNNNPLDLGVWRNGIRSDLKNTPLYSSDVIRAAWGSGRLEVLTPTSKFWCRVDSDGGAVFGEE